MVEPLKLGEHRARDTLQNVISGLGTYKDKTIATNYVFVPLGVPQLEAAYRGDWIARKITDIPAQDSTRMWRAWQAESDQITKLEDLEREHDIQGKVNKAITLARLYGGSALILGVEGAGTEKQELNLERVKEGSLKFVHAVHRWELGAQETDFDINSKNYRLPLYYTIRSGQGENIDVHWSRVIRFIGCPIPDPAQAVDGWGDSILQVVDGAVKGAGIVIGGIASLVQEAKIDVIKIPNLSERLSTKEYADKLAQRMTYANVIKSMNNALLIDSAEEWQRISTSFAALPDLLSSYLMCAAGAADIPVTRLVGQAPRGLNATGESDIRNYYDKIKSEQNTVLRPALSTLDEVLIRSALGSRPEEVFYEWGSLWQMNETEMADLAKKKADTFQIDVSTGLIDSNALRIGRENQLIEDGTYPGLEQTLLDQENGDLETEETAFAEDPSMNPDHPENLAKIAQAEAGAETAKFHAKNPLAAIQEKEKAKAKVVPFGKKKVSDFNPNHDPATGEFSSGTGGGTGGGGGGGSEEPGKWAERWETAKKVGSVALTAAIYGLAAWSIYRKFTTPLGAAPIDPRTAALIAATNALRNSMPGSPGYSPPGLNIAPLLPFLFPNSPGFGAPPALPPGQQYLPPTPQGPRDPALQGPAPTLKPGDPDYVPGRDPSTVPRPELRIDPNDLPPPRRPTPPPGPGHPDWEFPVLPPVQKKKFEPYVPGKDAAPGFSLARADVDALARELGLTPALKRELASLRFDESGNLISGVEDLLDAGDITGDGTDDLPTLTPPPPVVVTPEMIDAVTQAVLQALQARAPHAGKIKRVVREDE